MQTIIRVLASKEYAIPGSDRRFLGEKTIEAWYYAWRAHGINGLIPQQRTDRGVSKLPVTVQEALLAAKRENPRRSIRQLKILLENAGLVARDNLSRSVIHRFLQQHGLSRPTGSSSIPVEHRRFVAEHANSIWYGDVMHGPTLTLKTGRCKVFLVSLMDDASRLLAHSAFCTNGALACLHERFQWLLQSPGIGLLTGEAGVGKTAALRHLTHGLNPHRYQTIYLAETDFGSTDLYRSLALELGLEACLPARPALAGSKSPYSGAG